MIRFEYTFGAYECGEWDGAEFLLMDGDWYDGELVLESIARFNSEIHWDEMWDMGDAYIRFEQGHILFLLTYSGQAIGHVWYDRNKLYNAYVSQSRPDGLSEWFIRNTMGKISDFGYDTIRIEVDPDNLRAIKFWKKIGFIETF
jgi:ribosomal protein S18 acetylase RimI-like enzyme